jgi:hypothetical protein
MYGVFIPDRFRQVGGGRIFPAVKKGGAVSRHLLCNFPPLARFLYQFPATCSISLPISRHLLDFSTNIPPLARFLYQFPATCLISLPISRHLLDFSTNLLAFPRFPY